MSARDWFEQYHRVKAHAIKVAEYEQAQADEFHLHATQPFRVVRLEITASVDEFLLSLGARWSRVQTKFGMWPLWVIK